MYTYIYYYVYIYIWENKYIPKSQKYVAIIIYIYTPKSPNTKKSNPPADFFFGERPKMRQENIGAVFIERHSSILLGL